MASKLQRDAKESIKCFDSRRAEIMQQDCQVFSGFESQSTEVCAQKGGLNFRVQFHNMQTAVNAS